MPTVLRIGPYRLFFYSQDRRTEPAHVHVQREQRVAKVWIDPVRLDRSGGFHSQELREIMKVVEKHQQQLRESWNAFGH